jgi:transposase
VITIISQSPDTSTISKVGSKWVLNVIKGGFSGILSLPINTSKFTMSGVPIKKKPIKNVYTLAIPGGSHA